jgi:hypothetical protein
LLVGVMEAERPPACVPLDIAALLKASSGIVNLARYHAASSRPALPEQHAV